jgi:hypothetical protein
MVDGSSEVPDMGDLRKPLQENWEHIVSDFFVGRFVSTELFCKPVRPGKDIINDGFLKSIYN